MTNLIIKSALLGILAIGTTFVMDLKPTNTSSLLPADCVHACMHDDSTNCKKDRRCCEALCGEF